MTQRDYSYDILKGVGILLVLWGHTFCPPLVRTTIYSFHMPLFFFASGCFFKREKLALTISKKFKRLLLPWIVFAITLSLTFGALEYVKCHDLSAILAFYKSDIARGILGHRDSKCLYFTIWFLVSLFEVTAIYAVVRRFIKSDILVTCLLLVCYWGGVRAFGSSDRASLFS